jgi:hypothetical protein
MGADYSLELSTGMTPAEVLRLLVERLGFAWDGKQNLSGPALWVSAAATRQNRKQLIEEGFRFSPEVSVSLRVDPASPEYEEGHRALLRAAMLLIKHGRDGVLLFNGEQIILQSLGGVLVLNADQGGWTDGFMLEDEIQLPHEKRSLPSPLL